ncbi:hypothetical protein ACFPL7_22075 [Dongia soli]|uniref:Uncharacterized protein n=1 Tax=Dongia soli TaxID=600628 RepID=A0ABU5E7W5_9PROT|nr:hypothetical protein [Dongia soli]MDY0882278.1 hypothetical protein [Dongia soli]
MPAPHFTKRQVAALRAARDKGGAWYMDGQNMGGAKRRMIRRLAAAGYLSLLAPYALTRSGAAALAAAERKD